MPIPNFSDLEQAYLEVVKENHSLRKENQRLRDILTGISEYKIDAGLDPLKSGDQWIEWEHEETS